MASIEEKVERDLWMVFIVGMRSDLPDFVPPAETTPDSPITARQAIGDLAAMPWDKETSHIWSKAKRSGGQGDRRLVADRPGYTIRAECHGNIQFHYELPRRISMRKIIDGTQYEAIFGPVAE